MLCLGSDAIRAGFIPGAGRRILADGRGRQYVIRRGQVEDLPSKGANFVKFTGRGRKSIFVGRHHLGCLYDIPA